MAKSKSKETVTIINTGVAVIYVDNQRIMPDGEIEVSKDMLELSGIQYLIGRKELAVKDDSALNAEIVKKATMKKKADPTEGKTLKELEDGGEY